MVYRRVTEINYMEIVVYPEKGTKNAEVKFCPRKKIKFVLNTISRETITKLQNFLPRVRNL